MKGGREERKKLGISMHTMLLPPSFNFLPNLSAFSHPQICFFFFFFFLNWVCVWYLQESYLLVTYSSGQRNSASVIVIFINFGIFFPLFFWMYKVYWFVFKFTDIFYFQQSLVIVILSSDFSISDIIFF